MKKIFSLFLAAFIFSQAFAQTLTPDVTSWIQNTTAKNPSYPAYTSNCQLVQYSTNNVYVSCTCIPGYSIGPWNGNPNTPSNQNFVFKIPRNPTQQTGTTTAIGLGHIGVLTNGVSIFNVFDANYWDSTANKWAMQGAGTTHHTWNRNAYPVEGPGFDACLGHPQQQGEYHHHASPTCLYNQKDSTHHSPIIGYALDGFPVYGAYAYSDPNDPTSPIKRMKSSYKLIPATTRLNGPPVNTTYYLGICCEDYVFNASNGDLDARNGRFCKTPEYPNGIYCYFTTIDATLTPTFPYTFYGTYYGVVPTGNTGPNSGHQTITETVTTYTPSTVGVDELKNQTLDFLVFPNPTNTMVHIFIQPIYANDFTVELYDMMGRKIISKNNVHPTITESLDVSQVANGNYILKVFNSDFNTQQKVIIER